MATTEIQPQDVETMIIGSLVEFGADPDALARDATLESVDVDSLDLVELTQVVEERYEIDLEGADFKQVRTIGDIVDLVVARIQG
jgi:acyl carrier protein